MVNHSFWRHLSVSIIHLYDCTRQLRVAWIFDIGALKFSVSNRAWRKSCEYSLATLKLPIIIKIQIISVHYPEGLYVRTQMAEWEVPDFLWSFLASPPLKTECPNKPMQENSRRSSGGFTTSEWAQDSNWKNKKNTNICRMKKRWLTHTGADFIVNLWRQREVSPLHCSCVKVQTQLRVDILQSSCLKTP